ncbi:GNAT family N-acetyltransferase [Salisaeta longa]|uniref:GNAT family N-acetyltransferase n=1 Tax=Salisaeta longa TaxID=503170 RepID=UPI0003B75948|nr:GNAT family N-acetyltransferase [Salisaeta longa]
MSASPLVTAPHALDLSITEVDRSALPVIRSLNELIFDTSNVIRTFDREGLLLLLALMNDEPVGFKVGYALSEQRFYSAKGGVHPDRRRCGIARAMLRTMLEITAQRGYQTFVYDTFPNMHPGMTVLGLAEGFEVIGAGWSPQYEDYRIRFATALDDFR